MSYTESIEGLLAMYSYVRYIAHSVTELQLISLHFFTENLSALQ